MAGRIGQAVFVATLLAAVMALYGALVHGVAVPLERLPMLLLGLMVGAASFSALGLAISTIVPDAGAAPASINATILPLLLVSNVLVPLDQGMLATVAGVFPVRHLADILAAAYDPASPGGGCWVAGHAGACDVGRGGTGRRPEDVPLVAPWLSGCASVPR